MLLLSPLVDEVWLQILCYSYIWEVESNYFLLEPGFGESLKHGRNDILGIRKLGRALSLHVRSLTTLSRHAGEVMHKHLTIPAESRILAICTNANRVSLSNLCQH